MLKDILSRVKSGTILSAWSTTKKSNLTLSNGNRTATSTSANVLVQWIYSDTDLSGSVYIEVYGDWGIFYTQLVGLAPSGTTYTSTDNAGLPPAGSSCVNINNVSATIGISYNSNTGQYKIKRNNVLVASGTNARADMRIFLTRFDYNQQIGAFTINAGQQAFTYTPEYL